MTNDDGHRRTWVRYVIGLVLTVAMLLTGLVLAGGGLFVAGEIAEGESPDDIEGVVIAGGVMVIGGVWAAVGLGMLIFLITRGPVAKLPRRPTRGNEAMQDRTSGPHAD